MEIKTIPISKLKPCARNARIHSAKQIELLAKNIKRFGFTTPILIDEKKEIIAGHGRLEALKKMGATDAPCVEIAGLSKNEIKALRLADNQIASMGDWDMGLAISELRGLDSDLLDLTGFDKDLLIEPDENDDVIPEVKENKSRLGDLYELGAHRVLVGDATKREDVERLMGGRKGRLLFTSPPYNMNAGMYENYEDNLKSEEYINFNINTINVWKDYLFGFLFWNISYNKKTRWEFIEILYRIIKETGFKFLELVVWNKKHALPITSKEMMTRLYEDILVVGNDLEAGVEKDIEMVGLLRNDKKAYFNRNTGKYLSNYWEIIVNDVQLKNHLACYPVALPQRAIQIMSNEGDIILDPFLGSGSTLIAAQKTNRVCYGTEIDPHYCDVIVQRYVDYTGNENIIKNGKKITWLKN